MSSCRMRVCCALLLILACSCTSKPYSSEDRAADEQAIRSQEIEFSKAIAAKDLDKLVSIYSNDGALYDERHPILRGKRAIMETWRAAFAQPGATINAEPRTVEIADDGKLSWAHGTFTLTKQTNENPTHAQWEYASIYTKQPDGTWKITADNGNSGLQTNLFGRPLKERSEWAPIAPLIGIACLISLFWFVLGMPVIAIVGAWNSFRKRTLTTGLIVPAVMAAAFLLAAVLLWNLAAAHYWNLPLEDAFAAAGDTIRYGNPVEDTAEDVLVSWVVFSTLAATAAGIVTGISRWVWTRRRVLPQSPRCR